MQRTKKREAKLKIGIDAHAAERDGTGNCTYVRNLLLELGRLDKENNYFLYVTNPSHPFYEKLKAFNNFFIRKIPVKNPFLRIPFYLAGLTWRDKVDILHVQYIAPPFHRGKLVLTIHDLGHFFIPQSFSRLEVLRSRILIPYSARRAAKILTGSSYSRRTIIERFGLPPDKISVTPYGVRPEFMKAQGKAGAAGGEEGAWQEEKGSEVKSNLAKPNLILKKYGIQKPYIFTLSRLNLRKNLSLTIESFNLLKEQKNIPHKLVIAGKPDVRAREIKQAARCSPFRRDILFPGYVAEEDLPFLYGQAEAFIFLSEFEGFGLPVLEAMACGVPVLTVAQTSLPEVAGDAALYVSNLVAAEVTQKLEAILFDQNLRLSLAEKGWRRAFLFSWKKTAGLTLEAYNQAFRL